ncbi:MAG TPA: hypothetical protein VJ672_00965 [Gemmatimonadaceae bacterium]|nr:hypothetical protein [Gemmatimonadaceae bacterium]
MTQTATAPERTTLSRELSDFLLSLTVALQQYAMYPAGHPLLVTAMDNVTRRLAAVLAGRRQLLIGIARDQMVIDGTSTDPTNNSIRELASRLHRHQLGAIKIIPGVRRDELGDFLSAAAVDPLMAEQQLTPLAEQHHRWPHFRLFPLSYEKLGMLEEDAGVAAGVELSSGAAQLWVALARSVLIEEIPDEQALNSDPSALGQALDGGSGTERDQRVAGALIRIAGELRTASALEGPTLRGKVSTLVRSMRPETLSRLLSMGGDSEMRKRFVLDSSHELAVDAVLRIVEAAARDSRQTISHAMLRLLGKLALQSEQGGALLRAGADAAFRERVQSLVESWDIDRLNPDNYRQALERMSRLRIYAQMKERQHPCEPRRVMITAIESGTLGAPVWRAVQEMVTGKEIGPLLDLLDRAPAGNPIAADLWTRVATRENLRQLIREEQFEVSLLERISKRMGLEIVDVLLEGLENAESRAARRKLLDMLGKFGAEIAPTVAARLAPDRPWYVLRNLLTLLSQMPELPRGFSPTYCLSHPDARVRREALKLMLRMPTLRDEAIITAVGDEDERMVQTALSAAYESCPVAAVSVIIRRVDDRRIPPATRSLAIRAVAASKSQVALEWLLGMALAKRRWYSFRPRLASRSPDALAALAGLSASWMDEPRAAAAVELAKSSTDAEVRAATSARRISTPRGVPVLTLAKEDA